MSANWLLKEVMISVIHWEINAKNINISHRHTCTNYKSRGSREKVDPCIFGFMQSCSCLSCWISCSTAPGVMCTSSAHRLHIFCMSSACHLHMHVCCVHQDMSSAHCLQAICTTPHGHRGPELSFTVTGICYWMEFVAGMLNCFISGSCKWFAR